MTTPIGYTVVSIAPMLDQPGEAVMVTVERSSDHAQSAVVLGDDDFGGPVVAPALRAAQKRTHADLVDSVRQLVETMPQPMSVPSEFGGWLVAVRGHLAAYDAVRRRQRP